VAGSGCPHVAAGRGPRGQGWSGLHLYVHWQLAVVIQLQLQVPLDLLALELADLALQVLQQGLQSGRAGGRGGGICGVACVAGSPVCLHG
jgi:hypothetical protein